MNLRTEDPWETSKLNAGHPQARGDGSPSEHPERPQLGPSVGLPMIADIEDMLTGGGGPNAAKRQGIY